MPKTELRPYWFPVLCDDAWFAEIRKDYPDDAYKDDSELREEYADGCKYATTWDHIGDAMGDFQPLADAYLGLLETGSALQADREMLHRLISKMRTDEAQTIEEVLEGITSMQAQLAAAEGLLDDRRWFKAWAIIGDDGELLSREERGIGVIYGMDQAEIDDLIGDLWGGIEEMDLDVPCGAHCAEFIVKNPVHQEGQMSFPETGQWDFPPHWEMDIKVISYEVEDATILSRRTKNGGPRC